MGYAETGRKLRRPAMKADTRPASGLANHFDFQPVDPAADPRAESLGGGLLGRETGSKAFSCVALAHAIGLLPRGEHTIEETLPEALHRLLNARNLNQINAAADNHC